MTGALLGFLTLLWASLTLTHFISLLQYFQLHEYLNLRFLKWAAAKWRTVIRPIEILILLLMAAGWLIPGLAQVLALLVGVAVLMVCSVVYFIVRERKRKITAIKPLVFTGRVKRLIGAGVAVVLLELIFVFRLWIGAWPFDLSAWSISPDARIYGYLLTLAVLSQTNCLNLPAANLLLAPYDALMRLYYISSARRILQRVNPLVIGITGSYGKTSTKEILAHLLSNKYEVLKTPRTYNTILGVCKVIREDLRPKHQVFIVEMGAYRPGEIAQICRLVKPRIGILTAVGPQHLERFKTLENVARAKYELIEALPPDGTAIFNGSDATCASLSQKTRVKALLYAAAPGELQPDLCLQNLELSDTGTSFELVGREQAPLPIRMKLLGRHNATNAVGAILAAFVCGVPLKESAHLLASVSPMEHRLQPIYTPNNITYIDNAYSSNPEGARVALEVLATFTGHRKILVTPGFAELGKIEAQEHEKLGSAAARVCDMIFLIGAEQRIEPIRKGIAQANFASERVYCYNRLSEARLKLAEIVLPGDVILFENDLPDIY